MRSLATQFVARRWAVGGRRPTVDVRPLTGGLESGVAAATVEPAGVAPTAPARFVVKELRGPLRRERTVYDALWTHVERPPAARLLGVEAHDDAEYLFLEHVEPISSWPWAESSVSKAVSRALARLHDASTLPRAAFDWNYESELEWSARETLSVALSAREQGGARHWRRIGDLRRVVDALPAIRRRLESHQTVIHGDVHPGNVIVRERDGEREVALVDWGRARIGSPLEDVASWLQALGCWEPEARRRHDTLLRVYLESRAERRPLCPELRRAYWYAAASNGLAGAIRYHIVMLDAAGTAPDQRVHSWKALRAWERVIRQAAALVTTSSAR